MYKEQMDGGTILFVGDAYCKGYALSYFNKNYNSINQSLQNVKNIYYKCNDKRSSWIDYKKALLKPQYRNLSYVKRILQGLIEETIDCNILPETDFTDYLGYTYKVGAGDGLTETTQIKPLMKVLPANITISEKDDYYSVEHGRVLAVDFKTDITNALIMFNGIFEPYHILNKTTVLYYQSEVNMPQQNGVIMKDWCDIVPYIWKNLYIKQKDLHPIRFDGEWLIFNEDIDSSCLLFYNGVMYYYEVNKLNKKYIKIMDIDLGNTSNFVDITEKVTMIRFRDENDRIVKQQRLRGFFNESDRTVYFPSAINNAIITYNGTYLRYVITPDNKAIKFRIPSDINLDINTGIDDNSQIYAVNFFSYKDEDIVEFNNYDMVYGTLSETANKILNKYKDIIEKQKAEIELLRREQELVYDDYEQELIYDDTEPNVYHLTYIPQPDSIRFHINGVHYEKDVYFIYTEETNTVEWLFTAQNNGFDITPSMTVGVIYDIDYAKNGITDIEEFKRSIKPDE